VRASRSVVVRRSASETVDDAKMERMSNQVQARSLHERREAALKRLRSGGNLWPAAASDRGPHLIPVSYWWDGACLTTSTFDNSRALTNIRTQPRVRASAGATTDVLMIDAAATIMAANDVGEAAKAGYAQVSGIPLGTPGYVYVQLQPERMQVWKGPAEFTGRTIMRDGVWLDEPVV
jgi:hypothetical protein